MMISNGLQVIMLTDKDPNTQTDSTDNPCYTTVSVPLRFSDIFSQTVGNF